jgi:hypothetical protein
MNIKLPHMPFRFDSPAGRMEITVRRSPSHLDGASSLGFAAAVTYLQPGALALERIPLSARANTYQGAMQALTEGFKVNPDLHAKDSVEFRVLTALCHATGVVDLDA